MSIKSIKHWQLPCIGLVLWLFPKGISKLKATNGWCDTFVSVYIRGAPLDIQGGMEVWGLKQVYLTLLTLTYFLQLIWVGQVFFVLRWVNIFFFKKTSMPPPLDIKQCPPNTYMCMDWFVLCCCKLFCFVLPGIYGNYKTWL